MKTVVATCSETLLLIADKKDNFFSLAGWVHLGPPSVAPTRSHQSAYK